MNNSLRKKLKTLPQTSGVYFHKDKNGRIIYIGKAAVLKDRVRQYFQKSRNRDIKTKALIGEINDTEWIEVETEVDALFLEAEMIRRYLPRYNILLRDDKSLQYIRIDIKSEYPTVTFTHRPMDDQAEYFGPYVLGHEVKKALRLLRRIFPYLTSSTRTRNPTHYKTPKGLRVSRLYQQIGLDPVLDTDSDIKDYHKNLRNLMSYLRGNRTILMKEIEKNMKQAATKQDFESAVRLRNKLYSLKSLKKQVVFSDREFMDISKDRGLQGLSDILNLTEPPKRIEGYDISHMQGTDTVASMVVFTGGIPDKTEYRKFKMRIRGNDDFAHMREVISRRLSPRNVKSWGEPNIFLIDGGKGQLSSAIQARDALGFDIPMIGLAKREEEIVVHIEKSNVVVNSVHVKKMGGEVNNLENFEIIRLPHSQDVVKLLQRIRDESHRFAITYHGTLKRNRQSTSWLDEVSGVGAVTKKRLIREFGSSRGVIQARQQDLIKLVGPSKAGILRRYIRINKR